MSEAEAESLDFLPERTELKATIGHGVKAVIWFGIFSGVFIFGAQSLVLIFALGYFLIWPNWTNGMRVLLGTIGFAFVVAFHILTPPELRFRIGFVWLWSLGGAMLLSVVLGGSRLIVDRRGLTFIDLWIPRFRPWSRIELATGPSYDGKHYLLTLKEAKDGRSGLKDWLGAFQSSEGLADHYGMERHRLGELLQHYRARAMEATI